MRSFFYFFLRLFGYGRKPKKKDASIYPMF
jgi:hypothetical protein